MLNAHDIVITHDNNLTTIEVDGENITEEGRIVEATLRFDAKDVPRLILHYDCYYDNIHYEGEGMVVHFCPQGKVAD